MIEFFHKNMNSNGKRLLVPEIGAMICDDRRGSLSLSSSWTQVLSTRITSRESVSLSVCVPTGWYS